MRNSNLNKNKEFYDSNKNIKKILASEDDVPPLIPSNHTNIIPTKITIIKKRRTKKRKTIKKRRTNTRKRRTTKKR